MKRRLERELLLAQLGHIFKKQDFENVLSNWGHGADFGGWVPGPNLYQWGQHIPWSQVEQHLHERKLQLPYVLECCPRCEGIVFDVLLPELHL